MKETCLINTFLKYYAVALKKHLLFHTWFPSKKDGLWKEEMAFLRFPNIGEVLGTQPLLWLLSPIIALGCVMDVQHI